MPRSLTGGYGLLDGDGAGSNLGHGASEKIDSPRRRGFDSAKNIFARKYFFVIGDHFLKETGCRNRGSFNQLAHA